MRARPEYDLPAELEPVEARAKRLEWATIFLMLTIVVVIYFTMGSSQAMKAAWIEDMLSFVPPIAFLVSARWKDRPADEGFPYGYHRSVSIAFLAGAVALTIFGVFILNDSILGLVRQEHPTIGTSVVFGHQLWAGWLMIAVLAYSAIPSLVLGHMKLEPARALHDKTLKADSDMNRADLVDRRGGHRRHSRHRHRLVVGRRRGRPRVRGRGLPGGHLDRRPAREAGQGAARRARRRLARA